MSGSKSWECVECGMRVSFDAPQGTDGVVSQPSQPPNWIERPSGWVCLGCRREAAMDAETSEELPGTRPQQRRRALVEFELEREPGATDSEIARRVKSTTARVASIRADLDKDGNPGGQGA